MARVIIKSQGSFSGKAAAVTGVVVAVLVVSIPLAVWAFLLVGMCAGLFFFHRHKTRQAEAQRAAHAQAEAAERRGLEAHLASHSRTLCIRYAGLAAANGYGTPDAAAWTKEIQRFVDSVGFTPGFLSPELVQAMVTAHVQKNRQQSDKSVEAVSWSAEAMNDPMAFEQACAAQLRARGWDANTTVGSGDQGIDVQGRKAGVRVVVQCKLYSQPVGNGAVQEALSGKAFAKAHIAAVVSNASFTRKAHELAEATGVLLLHHTDIGRIDEHAQRLRQAYFARKAAATQAANSEAVAVQVERGLMGTIKKSA